MYISRKQYRKKEKDGKNPPFFEKIIDNLQINYLRLVLAIKKDNLIYIRPVGAGGYIPEYVIELNILGFQLPFFLYYDYGLNAFNCQAICYFYRSIFGLAFFILQVNII